MIHHIYVWKKKIDKLSASGRKNKNEIMDHKKMEEERENECEARDRARRHGRQGIFDVGRLSLNGAGESRLPG
jgi:hypothetical protein